MWSRTFHLSSGLFSGRSWAWRNCFNRALSELVAFKLGLSRAFVRIKALKLLFESWAYGIMGYSRDWQGSTGFMPVCLVVPLYLLVLMKLKPRHYLQLAIKTLQLLLTALLLHICFTPMF